MKSESKGFTIIELLVATVVFSVVLVGILAAFIQVSRMFYKGVNMANTQTAARVITQDIENDITFASSTPPDVSANGGTASGSFCVGAHRYAYYLGVPVGTALSGVYRETMVNGCPPLTGAGGQAVATGTADQLLSNGMQLNQLSLSCSVGRCRVGVHVIFYGATPDGLFGTANYSAVYPSNPWLAPDAECTGSLTSSQYCATATFNRTILQRV